MPWPSVEDALQLACSRERSTAARRARAGRATRGRAGTGEVEQRVGAMQRGLCASSMPAATTRGTSARRPSRRRSARPPGTSAECSGSRTRPRPLARATGLESARERVARCERVGDDSARRAICAPSRTTMPRCARRSARASRRRCACARTTVTRTCTGAFARLMSRSSAFQNFAVSSGGTSGSYGHDAVLASRRRRSRRPRSTPSWNAVQRQRPGAISRTSTVRL